MKTCRDCGAVHNFSQCRVCHYKKQKEWRQRPEVKARNKIRQRIKYLQGQVVIRDIKSRPCTDCGKKFPWYVMELDHIGEKRAGIGKLASASGILEKELSVCEPVCANCHRNRTYSRADWIEDLESELDRLQTELKSGLTL